jgi:hypothetical protein
MLTHSKSYFYENKEERKISAFFLLSVFPNIASVNEIFVFLIWLATKTPLYLAAIKRTSG